MEEPTPHELYVESLEKKIDELKAQLEKLVIPKIAEEIISDLQLFSRLTIVHCHEDENEWQTLNGYGCLLKASEKIRDKYIKKPFGSEQ